MSWALIVPLITIIHTTCTFLDDHHIPERSKDSFRLILVRFFFFVDSVRIPSIPSILFKKTLSYQRKISKYRLVLYVSMAWTPLMLFDMGMVNETLIKYPQTTKDGVRIMLLNALVESIVPAVIHVAIVLIIVRWVFSCIYGSRYFFVRVFAIPVSFATWIFCLSKGSMIFSYHWVAIAWFRFIEIFPKTDNGGETFFSSGNMFVLGILVNYNLQGSSLFAFIPVVLSIILLTSVAMIRFLLMLIAKLFALIAHSASSPKSSPYKYFSALSIAFLVIGKAIHEYLTK